MKNWLIEKLGVAGIVIWYLFGLLLPILPALMLNLPFWAFLLVVVVVQFLPFLQTPLWIVGFFGAINGEQDVFAYIYYVLCAIIVLITLIRLGMVFFGKS